MATPSFSVEAAFGSGPRDASYSWTSLSTRARACTYQRGRQFDLDRVEQGTGTVELLNSDRALEGNYASSPYYPNVIPLVPIRAYCTLAATTYYLFEHYVGSWSRVRTGPNSALARVTTVDAFEIFSRALLQPSNAVLTTALGGNRDLTYTAINPGADGNKITVTYKVTTKGSNPQVSTSLSSGVIQILVQAKTSHTFSQVLTALNNKNDVAAALSIDLAAGSTGAGTFVAMAQTHLSGGVSVAFPAQLTGARVTAALDWISWPSALRSVGTGAETIQARTLAPGDTLTALQVIQEAVGEGGDEGIFFMDGRGRAVFLDRRQMVTTPYTTSQATFTDQSSESSYVPYQAATWGDDMQMIYNEWTGRRQGGYAFTVRDDASQAKYGPRSRQITSIVSTKDEMRRILQWRLANYKDPLDRLESITVKPGASTAAWQACLGREPGDRVTVRQHPPGGGSVDARDYFVQQVTAAVDFTNPASSSFVFQLWPATNANWMVVGDPVFGLVGQNKVAA